MPDSAVGCLEFLRAGRLSRRRCFARAGLACAGSGWVICWRRRLSAARQARRKRASCCSCGAGRRSSIPGIPSRTPRPRFAASSNRSPRVCRECRSASIFLRLARLADQYAIIRSMTHDDAAHLSSVHHVMTGRLAPTVKSDAVPPSRRDSPAIGSALARLRPTGVALPPFVTMPWIVSHPAAPGARRWAACRLAWTGL